MRTPKTTRSAQPKEGNSLENVAANFLNLLRPEGPWQLTAIWPERTRMLTREFDKLDDARKWIAEYNTKANLYFTANTQEGSPDKKPEKANIKTAEWLWIDIDFNDPGKAVKGSPPMTAEWMQAEKARIHELLTTKLPLGIPAPTAIVFTGGGYQALWRLDKPIQIDGEKARWEDYERYNKWLEGSFGADHCHNCERILRLPGSINIPDTKKAARGRKQMRTELVGWNGGAYGLKDFKQAAATAAKPRTTSGAIEQDVFSIDPSRVQGIEDITDLAKYGVPRDCQEIIAQGSDPDNPTRFPSGSEAQWYVTCELARRGVPAEVIYSIIADGTWQISAHVRRQKHPHTYALGQIAKAMDEAHDPDLAWFNEKHFVVGQDGGDCLVYEWLEIPRPKGKRDAEPEPDRVYLAHMSFEAFVRRYHKSKKITNAKGEEVSIPIGKWWLKHERRRQYEALIFDPSGPTVDDKGRLNLWRGFAVEPSKGDWSLMRRHVYVVLAGRDPTSFKYIMRWAAWTVQNPGIPARAVVSFRGDPGVGKGVFLRGLGWIFGQHGFHTSAPGHIYGRFNDHLRDCCFLFADEALAPEDKESVSKMKALITEPTVPVEGKGKKIIQSANCLHIAMASNAEWMAPVEKGDRRYAVFDAKLDITDKAERKAYFAALYAEQRDGGRAAMLHDLLAMNLGDWSPEEIPDTDARDEMKLLGRSPYYDPVREVLGDVKDGRMLSNETRKLLPSREPDEYERKHEKMLAAAMRELGWERKKVRVDGKLGWFYAIGNPQQCEYVVRREPRALGRGAKVDVVEKGNEGGSSPTSEGGSRNGTPFG